MKSAQRATYVYKHVISTSVVGCGKNSLKSINNVLSIDIILFSCWLCLFSVYLLFIRFESYTLSKVFPPFRTSYGQLGEKIDKIDR